MSSKAERRRSVRLPLSIDKLIPKKEGMSISLMEFSTQLTSTEEDDSSSSSRTELSEDWVDPVWKMDSWEITIRDKKRKELKREYLKTLQQMHMSPVRPDKAGLKVTHQEGKIRDTVVEKKKKKKDKGGNRKSKNHGKKTKNARKNQNKPSTTAAAKGARGGRRVRSNTLHLKRMGGESRDLLGAFVALTEEHDRSELKLLNDIISEKVEHPRTKSQDNWLRNAFSQDPKRQQGGRKEEQAKLHSGADDTSVPSNLDTLSNENNRKDKKNAVASGKTCEGESGDARSKNCTNNRSEEKEAEKSAGSLGYHEGESSAATGEKRKQTKRSVTRSKRACSAEENLLSSRHPRERHDTLLGSRAPPAETSTSGSPRPIRLVHKEEREEHHRHKSPKDKGEEEAAATSAAPAIMTYTASNIRPKGYKKKGSGIRTLRRKMKSSEMADVAKKGLFMKKKTDKKKGRSDGSAHASFSTGMFAKKSSKDARKHAAGVRHRRSKRSKSKIDKKHQLQKERNSAAPWGARSTGEDRRPTRAMAEEDSLHQVAEADPLLVPTTRSTKTTTSSIRKTSQDKYGSSAIMGTCSMDSTAVQSAHFTRQGRHKRRQSGGAGLAQQQRQNGLTPAPKVTIAPIPGARDNKTSSTTYIATPNVSVSARTPTNECTMSVMDLPIGHSDSAPVPMGRNDHTAYNLFDYDETDVPPLLRKGNRNKDTKTSTPQKVSAAALNSSPATSPRRGKYCSNDGTLEASRRDKVEYQKEAQRAKKSDVISPADKGHLSLLLHNAKADAQATGEDT